MQHAPPSLQHELDYSHIVWQRLAKGMIRERVVIYLWNRSRQEKKRSAQGNPLSMIFAGPSGNGKTELAQQLSELLNDLSEQTLFHKVDCGKMRESTEVFGLSCAYRGSQEGSALNNFVTRMTRKPNKIGVVLLDEFDKLHERAVKETYQVLDKGEWTNKQLIENSGSQTLVVDCKNVIFIMAVNAADNVIVIEAYTSQTPQLYTDSDLCQYQRELESMIQAELQESCPFTKAFIGKVDSFVPFLPMCAKTSGTVGDPLEEEMLTMTKLLIKEEMKDLDGQCDEDLLQLDQTLSPTDKHRMADLIVDMANPESSARSIQRCVNREMVRRLMHAWLSGRISQGCEIKYTVDR